MRGLTASDPSRGEFSNSEGDEDGRGEHGGELDVRGQRDGGAQRGLGGVEQHACAGAGQRREGGHAHSRDAAGKEHGEVEGGD
jgi:hypothetical protein